MSSGLYVSVAKYKRLGMLIVVKFFAGRGFEPLIPNKTQHTNLHKVVVPRVLAEVLFFDDGVEVDVHDARTVVRVGIDEHVPSILRIAVGSDRLQKRKGDREKEPCFPGREGDKYG